MGPLLRVSLSVAACLAIAGCAARDPLNDRVAAESPIGLQMWLSRNSERLPPDQASDLREALQELRFKIMAEGRVSGSAPVEEALCGEIDGKAVREVLFEGFERQLQRLTYERNALAVSNRENARLRVRPGDTASADYLERERGRVSGRLDEASEAVARAKRILARYSGQYD
jgi:hypothetical protein